MQFFILCRLSSASRLNFSFIAGMPITEFLVSCVCPQSLQSCPTLCDPMDCSPPDSSVHGLLQARILEWVVMPSSRGSSQPRDRTHICLHLLKCRQILYPPSHLGSLTLALPILNEPLQIHFSLEMQEKWLLHNKQNPKI